MAISFEGAAFCDQVAKQLDERIHGITFSQSEVAYLAMMRAFRDLFQVLADVLEEHGG